MMSEVIVWNLIWKVTVLNTEKSLYTTIQRITFSENSLILAGLYVMLY